MIKNLLLLFILFLSCEILTAQNTNVKYEKWKFPSYFRGMNVLPAGPAKTQQDINDLKAAGASFASLSCDDILNVDPPYQLNPENVAALDSLVKFCRNSGLYYTISARSGPGRRDVYFESEEGHPKSTIWVNDEEQKLYASMIKFIAVRYGDDPLFVGIAPIVEPNPLFDKFYLTAPVLKKLLEKDSINLRIIYNLIIDSVRSVDANLPILVQNVAYSSPEFFSIMTPYADRFIVYEFHSYRPQDFTKYRSPNELTYPGSYLSIDPYGIYLFDKEFFAERVFKHVRSFQAAVDAPILLGEFGLLFPQNGGDLFLKDISSLCVEYGWHFAYWEWRREIEGYNYEKMGDDYWVVVKNSFVMPINSAEQDMEEKCISIFPVIVNSDITIKSDCDVIRVAYIYDVLGNLVLSSDTELSNGQGSGNVFASYILNMSHLPAGQYFIQIRTMDKFYMKRIIKVVK